MRNEIDLYKIEATPESLQKALIELRQEFDSHNHDGSSSKSFQTLGAETISSQTVLIRKTSYTDTSSGIWYGIVGGVLKLNLGNASNYLKWTGSAISISGDITGGSLNINNNAVIDSSGNATFVGMFSLNMKAYTNFESSGRFVLTGDVAPTFTNRGMRVAPGAVATHYARALWNPVNSIFNNNPSFTAAVFVDTIGSTNGVGFVGLGVPTISGSGFTETGRNYCGFEFKKISGVLTVIAVQCDGGGTVTFSSTLDTLSNSDVIELFLKKTSSGINYYTRKNGGTLSSATTLSATMPSGLEDNISFMVTNKGEAEDFILQLQCAAYEH